MRKKNKFVALVELKQYTGGAEAWSSEKQQVRKKRENSDR